MHRYKSSTFNINSIFKIFFWLSVRLFVPDNLDRWTEIDGTSAVRKRIKYILKCNAGAERYGRTHGRSREEQLVI